MTPDDSLHFLKNLKLKINGLKFDRTEVSSVTTAWGVDWTEEMVARDLLQNFFDANRGRVSEIRVTLIQNDVLISAPAEYSLNRLLFLGSEKGPDDVGQYGEGFKAAVTCVLREHGNAVAAVSGKQAVVIRVSETPVSGTEKLFPLIYDFFTCDAVSGNRLVLRGCSAKLRRALEDGLTHFFYDGNPLIGEQLGDKSDKFSMYRSTSSDGHIFYCNLKRGEIPDVPLILVVKRPYAEIEKKVKSDRDRKAFGEELRSVFFKVLARGLFDWQGYQRIAVNAARSFWERGEGHPLLAAIAETHHYRGAWAAEDAKKIFGDTYFARSSDPQDTAGRIQYDTIEREWRNQGRKQLPGYFSKFGVISAEAQVKEAEEKARREARDREQRPPTLTEARAIKLLSNALAKLAPAIEKVFATAHTTYTVAATDTLLGELRGERKYQSREVYLAEKIFEEDFAHSLAVFLHEHAHIFGYDGSRGFSDALTELIEVVIRFRHQLDDLEAQWEGMRQEIRRERKLRPKKADDAHKQIASLDHGELLKLVHGLPAPVLQSLLRQRDTK